MATSKITYDATPVASTIKLRSASDVPIQFVETGDEDYKGIISYDKNNRERYRLHFGNGHLYFTSKDASGNIIVSKQIV